MSQLSRSASKCSCVLAPCGESQPHGQNLVRLSNHRPTSLGFWHSLAIQRLYSYFVHLFLFASFCTTLTDFIFEKN